MRSPRPILPLVLLSLVTACASTPEPRLGAGGYYKVGKPYQVNGKTYVPKDDRNYQETGVASWYGPGFHAKTTANGEHFDQDAVTAAHRTLPMPSHVEVQNLENGRKLVVRVNDRDPFAKDRIIDLSRRAAQLLGFDTKGTARVKLRRVYPDERRQDVAENPRPPVRLAAQLPPDDRVTTP